MKIEDMPAFAIASELAPDKVRPLSATILPNKVRIGADDLADLIRDVFYRDIGEVLTPEHVNRNIGEILRRARLSPSG